MELSDANVVLYFESSRTTLWEQLKTPWASLRWIDLLIFTCILSFGTLQFFSCQRVPNFQRDDIFYADAARSMVEHGFYGINGHEETNQPPGVPAFLALLCLAGSCTRLVFLRAMVVFETVGFLVTYELLRRQVTPISSRRLALCSSPGSLRIRPIPARA